MSKKYGELIHYDIIFEGILKKSPPQKPKAFFNFITKFSCTRNFERSLSFFAEKWRKRHFVLYKTSRPNQVYLLYFKLEPTSECKSIGNINLVDLTNLAVDVGSTVNRSNVFSIQTIDDKGDTRVYYLCALSLDMMNTWVEKIVANLNLNNHNSRSSIASTAHPTLNHNISRGTSRASDVGISSPKQSSTSRSTHASSEGFRFTFPIPNEPEEKNNSAYYNLSPGKSPVFHDFLVDPTSTEEEDVYKYPCESPYHNPYANIVEEGVTPIGGTSNVIGDLFFSNEDDGFHYTNCPQSTNNASFQEFVYSGEDSVFSQKELSADSYEKFQKIPQEKKFLEQNSFDFDFPLPTRVRSDSSSSGSTSDSSASDEEVHIKETNVPKPQILAEPEPPLVPKRLNLPDRTFVTTETVLPVKTPKILSQKMESFDLDSSCNDESVIALNYLDAENLVLENRTDMVRDSTYCSLDLAPSHGGIYMAPSAELKLVDFGGDHGASPHSNTLDLKSSLSIVKEIAPSVEYREICDVRTEAVSLLSARILNN